MSANQRQVGGDHYMGSNVQPWDIVAGYRLDFFEGNVLKYLLRKTSERNRVEDLRKAIHYLEKKIELLESTVTDGEP